VGVIDDDSEWLPGLDACHSARHGWCGRQCRGDCVQFDSCRKCDSSGTDRVGDIELADQRQDALGTTSITSVQNELAASPGGMNIERPYISIDSGCAIPNDRGAIGEALDCTRASIVRVDDRHARVRGHALQQDGFGELVILDRPVIIEVLARDVRHCGNAEAHMIQPVHRKPVRGRL
jgi:hypothetical protein